MRKTAKRNPSPSIFQSTLTIGVAAQIACRLQIKFKKRILNTKNPDNLKLGVCLESKMATLARAMRKAV